MGVVTPKFIVDFETTIHATLESSWDDTAADLQWDKIMKVIQSQGRTELLVWLLDAAGISLEGQGGNRRFEDMAAQTHRIVNENSGNGLQLTNNELEDGVILLGSGERATEMNILDYAGAWARNQGSSAAYWPEERLWALVRSGETNKAYDGQNFFSTTHPVHPFKPGLGNYSNLHANVNLTPAQFAAAWAQVRQIKGANGKVRKLRPRKIIVPSGGKFAALQLFQAKFLGTPQGGSVDNILTAWGIDEIIEVPELEDERSWYLVCDVPNQTGLAAFVYTDRKPYQLNSYTDLSDVELGRADMFEWHFKGRNGIAYGHPFLIHKFTLPAGKAWGED